MSGGAASRDPHTVLHVDTDCDAPANLAERLEHTARRFEVVGETDPTEALARFDTAEFDCLVTGYDLPDMTGIELLRSVRQRDETFPVVLFTGDGSEAIPSRAITAGVTEYIRKRPGRDDLDSLAARIQELVQSRRRSGEPDYDSEQFDRFRQAFPDAIFVMDEEGRYRDVISAGDQSLLYVEAEELIGRRYHELLPDETAKTLAERTEADHAERIIAAVDELAAIGAGARETDRLMSMDDERAEIDLSESLSETIDTLEDGTDVELTTALSSTTLTTNEQAVQIAVESALENALEHAESVVSVAVEDGQHEATVTIADDGPGIPGEQLVPIETGTETALRHGRGLGLWQLRWSVDTLNGELSFDTTEGTTVHIHSDVTLLHATSPVQQVQAVRQGLEPCQQGSSHGRRAVQVE